MYKTIIMPVDVFEMALSDKAVRHAEFLAQQDGGDPSAPRLTGFRELYHEPFYRRPAAV